MPPADLRLPVALGAMFLAGVSKGVTGLGVPLVATPVLALLYGDLQLAIATGIIPTVVSDIPFVVRGRGFFREFRRFLPFVLSAAGGMAVGTGVLVRLDQSPLKLLLGLITLGFVAVNWGNRAGFARSKGLPRPVSILAGLAAGLLQGMAGASGPVVTMFLFGAGLPREVFLFVLNAIFLAVDISQFLSLLGTGIYGRVPLVLGLLWVIPVAAGMAVGFRTADRISVAAFRRAVLLLLALSGLSLLLSAAGALLTARRATG